MSFGNLTEDATIAAEKDTLGGSNFGPLGSGVYRNMKIVMAYVQMSKGGAMGIILHLLNQDTGKELKQTLWVQSGTAKGSKNYYETKNGEKRYLPGFEIFSAITKLGANLLPSDMTVEEKTVSLWSYEEKKDVPTQVDVIMPLLGKFITLGIVKQTVDKTINVNGPNETPNYMPTGETRDENEIKKVFRAEDGLTVAEASAEATEAVFINTWANKNTGVTIDRSTKVAAPAAGAAPSASGSIAFGAAASTPDAKPSAPIFGAG